MLNKLNVKVSYDKITRDILERISKLLSHMISGEILFKKTLPPWLNIRKI